VIAVNFGHRNFFSELAQFVATLRRHRHVQLRAAGWVTHLVVLETGEQRIFSVENARARRNVLRDLIDGYGLCVCRGVRSGLGSIINFARSGSSNASMRVASDVSLRMKTGVLYFRAIRAASIAI
jgi:hypothetical protein